MNLDRGARPLYRSQSPANDAECDALEIARARAVGELPQPRDEWGHGSREGRRGNRSQSGTGIGCAKLTDGSGYYAQVHWAGPGEASTSYIRKPSGDPHDIHGHDVKGWAGIPQRRTGDMRRIPPGRIDIHAPPEQRQYVYEDIHIVHQRRINHHHAPDQIIEHGAPQHLQVGMDPTQVHVHQSDRVIEQHHAPKQSALGAILFGVRKPQQQQQALPQPQYAPPPQQQHALPPPQSIDRGFLLPAPTQPQQRQTQPQPLAIAHQPGVPMQATRKKSWSIL